MKSTRKKELLEYIDNDVVLIPLIDEMVYLEQQLESLRKLPKIKVNPKNKAQQKKTPAANLYKEFLQQYMQIIRTISKKIDEGLDEEESPLRKWLKENEKTMDRR